MAKISLTYVQEQAERKLEKINEEHATLVALPDKEFLKSETQERLSALHKAALSCVKTMMRKSKYFDKHYKVEEAEPDEVQCPYCKKIFAVDYEWLTYFTQNVDEDWARCYCPYCGKVKQWCI